MFHIRNNQRQLILQVSPPKDDLLDLIRRNTNNGIFTTFHTNSTTFADLKTIDQIIEEKELTGNFSVGYPVIYRSVVNELHAISPNSYSYYTQ